MQSLSVSSVTLSALTVVVTVFDWFDVNSISYVQLKGCIMKQKNP